MTEIFGDIGRTILLYRNARSDASEDDLDVLNGGGMPSFESLSTKSARKLSTPAASAIDPKQFRLFVLQKDSKDEKRHFFSDPHDVAPTLLGEAKAPDVRAKIEMLAFYPGEFSTDQDHAAATLRLDVGQNKLASSALNPLFWSIAAGLDLASAVKQKDKAAPTKYSDDFDPGFGQRPIEFPGGLAQMRFQVVRHPQPAWWQEIFSFLKTGAGEKLISSLGFPGITAQAIRLIDQAFGVLQKPDILFKSDKMDFALTQYGREQYTMGMPGVEIGVLNPGFFLLAPHRHQKSILDLRPKFLAGIGRLIPAEWPAEKYGGAEANPFDAMPYAVLRIRSEAVSLAGSLG